MPGPRSPLWLGPSRASSFPKKIQPGCRGQKKTRLSTGDAKNDGGERFFLRPCRKRFDTSYFLLYTLLFVRVSFTQAVTRHSSCVVVMSGFEGESFETLMQLEGSSLPEHCKTDWERGAAGYGTPVPQSRVSLSKSKPRAEFCLLECVRSFLLVSPDSQFTFQRSVRSLELSAR